MNLLSQLRRIAGLLQAIKRVDSEMLIKANLAYLQRQKQDLLKEIRYQDPLRLNRYERQVFSQNGEDGIIAEIFRRIDVTDRSFLEIGVGNGLENNTAFLLLQGWTGAWIDGDEASVRFIERHFHEAIREEKLRAIRSKVTAENIGRLIEQAGILPEPALVSVDIDRNTYWVLEALLKKIQPAVLVIEYNSLILPDIDWKVRYDSERMWNGTSYTGASLKAYELLCRKYSYSLVGCEVCGINAFFVKDELCGDKFARPFTSENHYEPLRDYLVFRVGPERSMTDMESK